MPLGRFDPQPLRLYLARRDREIAQAFRSKFLLSDGLRNIIPPNGGTATIVGTLLCEGDIRIEVEEKLTHPRLWLWRHDPEVVVLSFYRYNAVLKNGGLIFRYNSPHKTHNKFHHLHRYENGVQIKPPLMIPPDEVPTLRQVVKKAEEWYYDHLV